MPTVGRIVHFRETADASCQAAIVTAPANDEGDIEVVLFRGGNDTQQAWAAPTEATQWRTGVAEDGTEGKPTWHWPEREEEKAPSTQPSSLGTTEAKKEDGR